MSRENKIGGVAMILVGVGATILSVLSYVRDIKDERAAQGRLATTATTSVECSYSRSLVRRSDGKGNRVEERAQYRFSYVVDGVELRGHTTIEDECLVIDGPMEVAYEPAAPKQSELTAGIEARIAGTKTTMVYMIGFMLAFCLCGVVIFRLKEKTVQAKRPTGLPVNDDDETASPPS